jgi:hypothetical protein
MSFRSIYKRIKDAKKRYAAKTRSMNAEIKLARTERFKEFILIINKLL